MPKKLGLCLGSGGARGIAHIGFLQALDENNINIDVITGCSMGSLVGALYLCGYSPSSMLEIAVALKKNDIFDLSIGVIRNKALLKSIKLDKLLKKYLKNQTIEELNKPFACIATDLISGKIHTFDSGDLVTAVRSSCAVPIGFTPVKYNDMLLVDGGISNRTPVREARDLGADVVIAVDVLAEVPDADEINNIFSLGFRALDIMGVNINRYNDEGQKPDLSFVPDLGKTSQYKVENQQFCYDRGYELAIKNIKNIKKLIAD